MFLSLKVSRDLSLHLCSSPDHFFTALAVCSTYVVRSPHTHTHTHRFARRGSLDDDDGWRKFQNLALEEEGNARREKRAATHPRRGSGCWLRELRPYRVWRQAYSRCKSEERGRKEEEGGGRGERDTRVWRTLYMGHTHTDASHPLHIAGHATCVHVRTRKMDALFYVHEEEEEDGRPFALCGAATTTMMVPSDRRTRDWRLEKKMSVRSISNHMQQHVRRGKT